MSKVLILSIPSHGHMNPILGLATELAHRGEEITFFSSEEFKTTIEEIGAEFKCYQEDLNLFQTKKDAPSTDQTTKKSSGGLIGALLQPEKFIDVLLNQIKGLKFDYIIFSAAYPYASTIASILQIPAISSFAVFATLKELMPKTNGPDGAVNKPKGMMGITPETVEEFKIVRQRLIEKYKVEINEDIFNLLFNKGNLNIIYTSEYFIPNPENYDESYIFVGPPIYNKKYEVDFPFEKLKGKKVIYISLGTVFSNYSAELNHMFFQSFTDPDTVVVMAAYQVDLSKYEVPDNFIIREYVPQLEILKHTTVAITHAGMNSIGDLLYNNIPFVSIPLGADQFYLANRAQELGATIVLDINNLNTDLLKSSVAKVLTDPSYLKNIHKISESFVRAGGYKKAVDEIFKLKSPQ
ncbi:MGT family glycosyltransferase [Pedobacter cryoconitis]|uniref:MGT family glycosyltransferase n=1 Tax=Pedobacter cryoconitis TaxID=188932 RepID=A0A7W8ZQD2_9SPHI|nr:macrolide family glycosyltransferase [Pedobacter cryoconitis]MBB5638266.1 MGT family glycosyltransferase [Pedobacter cryoconitis]